MTQPAKHTPGPLHNVTGHRPGPWIRQVLNDESEAYIHDKHCNAIARVYSLSDAALIAAAPAMYEALQGCLRVAQAHLHDTLARWEDCEGKVPSGIAELDAARMEVVRIQAVLSQAEGQQL